MCQAMASRFTARVAPFEGLPRELAHGMADSVALSCGSHSCESYATMNPLVSRRVGPPDRAWQGLPREKTFFSGAFIGSGSLSGGVFFRVRLGPNLSDGPRASL